MHPIAKNSSDMEMSGRNFWKDFYLFVLKAVFVHPRMFVASTESNVYPLHHSVRLIDDIWDDFVMLNVRLSVEDSTLTSDMLSQHNISNINTEQDLNPYNDGKKHINRNVLPIRIP